MGNLAETNCLQLAVNIDGTYRQSRRGVPHVTKKIGDITYSTCFFIRGNFWRVFYPYGQFEEQTKITMKSANEVIDFMKEKENES